MKYINLYRDEEKFVFRVSGFTKYNLEEIILLETVHHFRHSPASKVTNNNLFVISMVGLYESNAILETLCLADIEIITECIRDYIDDMGLTDECREVVSNAMWDGGVDVLEIEDTMPTLVRGFIEDLNLSTHGADLYILKEHMVEFLTNISLQVRRLSKQKLKD